MDELIVAPDKLWEFLKLVALITGIIASGFFSAFITFVEIRKRLRRWLNI
jgi:hypothetical protein